MHFLRVRDKAIIRDLLVSIPSLFLFVQHSTTGRLPMDEVISCVRRSSLLWLWVVATLECATAQSAGPVRLQSVRELVLVKGRQTTYSRTGGIHQLTCLENCEFEPEMVKCVNVRSYRGNVEWSCKANLPSHLEFGKIRIDCEGYDSPEDDRVLEGSCGLIYSLQRNGRQVTATGTKPGQYQEQTGIKEGWTAKKFAVLVASSYIIYYLYRVCFVSVRRVAD